MLKGIRILALAASTLALPALAATPSTVVADGMQIHFGLMAGEKLRGYPHDSPEARMHGGVPKGDGYYHVNVSLFDVAKQAPIGNARVQVQVDEPGVGTATKVLEPMVINGAASYGSYFRLGARKPYWFTVRVQKDGYVTETEAKFHPWTD